MFNASISVTPQEGDSEKAGDTLVVQSEEKPNGSRER